MHMILCEPNFGKRILDPQFITIPPPLYEGPEDEVSSHPIYLLSHIAHTIIHHLKISPTL